MTTRIVLRVIALTHLLSAAFVGLIAVREFILVYLGAYGTTLPRTMFFLSLALLGLLGAVGTVGLLNYSNVGRRLTVMYLTGLMPILLFLPEEPTLRGWTPLLLAMLSVSLLVTSAARRTCGIRASGVIA